MRRACKRPTTTGQLRHQLTNLLSKRLVICSLGLRSYQLDFLFPKIQSTQTSPQLIRLPCFGGAWPYEPFVTAIGSKEKKHAELQWTRKSSFVVPQPCDHGSAISSQRTHQKQYQLRQSDPLPHHNLYPNFLYPLVTNELTPTLERYCHDKELFPGELRFGNSLSSV